MYSKLALRNIKRSFKDYTIYFLTLVFGVCIFYTFNSIDSQKVMMDVNEYYEAAFKSLSTIMGIFSVFISCILGFLIVYANNYLIKRRKKEFGVYMTLGMEKGKISKILIIETIIIGVISLGAGLILGVLLSQGLSVFTAKLFQVRLVDFKFIFSTEACIKTIVYFGVIYLIVLLFNSVSINRVKLIDLLTSSRRNESVKVKSIWLSIVIFIISLIIIGTAYFIILEAGIAALNLTMGISVILGCIGTFLFFFSLSGFLLKVAQGRKKHYLKDLNMFVIRQINSKVNTTFISMTFICLMLFVAICTFSGGLGLSKSLNKDIEDLTKFDATMYNYGSENIEKAMEDLNIDINKYASEYINYSTYVDEVKYSDFFSDKGMKENNSYYSINQNQNIPIIKVSDYNKLMKMLGEETITLHRGEYTAFGDITDTQKAIQEALDSKVSIKINGESLKPANHKVKEVTTYVQMTKFNMCTFIVPDELVEGLKLFNSFLTFNFKGDKELIESNFNNDLEALNNRVNNQTYYLTKENLVATSAGFGAMISYLAIYLGIIFLITSAAVLALQQLSESADNVERYKLLRKVGVDDEMINKSIFTQVAIYFMVPLSLALIHSIVGLKISSDIVSMFGSGSITNYILITAGILVVVYGGYFISTYIGAKKTIKS